MVSIFAQREAPVIYFSFLAQALSLLYKAHFKRRATAVPISIDRIKFDFSTAVVRRLKPSHATAV